MLLSPGSCRHTQRVTLWYRSVEMLISQYQGWEERERLVQGTNVLVQRRRRFGLMVNTSQQGPGASAEGEE